MILENQLLRVKIADQGAELKSIRAKLDGYEYLWNANPTYWGKTSPVLFPIVGALKEDTYYIESNAYRLPRHGFARDNVFSAQRVSDSEVTFTLIDTVETRIVYPFVFKLLISYRLNDDILSCSYHVFNPSESHPLLFSIGAHPAFAVNTGENGLKYSDYYLEFPADDFLVSHRLKDNLISDAVDKIPLLNHKLPLRYELFERDALVMKSLRSHEIKLGNNKNERALRFSYDDFPFFGIWAAKGADFVCLEPWLGIADGVDHNQKFEHKEGIMQLGPQQEWCGQWSVQVL